VTRQRRCAGECVAANRGGLPRRLHRLHRKDSDWVSGIYFASVDDGWVVSRQGGPGSDISGGAVLEKGCVYVVPLMERLRLVGGTVEHENGHGFQLGGRQ